MLHNAVLAAQTGADRTDRMQARVGRAAYVPAKHWQGFKDPGALAVGIWLSAILAALFGEDHPKASWE